MPKPTVRSEARKAASASAPEVVDPAWLIRAFVSMVLLALLCGYLALCALFYRGQWQLVLHPARGAAAPATVAGLQFQTVRFGAATTGVPELTGWWIPAQPDAPLSRLTVLYLPTGDGSLAEEQPVLASLHTAGLTIFAVDYRGYGQSAEIHPSEKTMNEDAQTAWDYLTGPRALAPETVIPYGRGLGAALALNLASSGRTVRALILDDPDFNVTARVLADPRSRLLPVRLLFHERFALSPALEDSKIPKLILSRGRTEDSAVHTAGDPKMLVALPSGASANEFAEVMRRFLDQYAPKLVPTPAPAMQNPK